MKFQMTISYLYYENLFRKLCKCFILPIFSLFFFLIIVLLTYSYIQYSNFKERNENIYKLQSILF